MKSNPRGGNDYMLAELLEWSAVSIGDNPAALAKSLTVKPPIDVALIKDVDTVIEAYRSAGDFARLEKFMHDVASANPAMFEALTHAIGEVY